LFERNLYSGKLKSQQLYNTITNIANSETQNYIHSITSFDFQPNNNMPSATPVRAFMRNAARYLSEPHPFGRNPVTQPAHKIDTSLYFKRVGTNAKL